MRISRFIYHIRHEKHLPKAVKFSITFAFVFVLLLSQNLVMVSAITQEQRNSIGSGARYFNTEEDGTVNGSNPCSSGAGYGSVDRLLKAIAKNESGGDPTAKNEPYAYGKYQYTPDTWKSTIDSYYPPASGKYAVASDAPEAVQDAVTFFKQAALAKKYEGSVWKIAIVWYYPVALEDLDYWMDRVPNPQYGNTLTIREYGNRIVDWYNNGDGADIQIIYSQLQDFQEWKTKNNLDTVPSVYAVKDNGPPPSGSGGTAAAGCIKANLILETIMLYAWPEYEGQDSYDSSSGKYVKAKPEYQAAMLKAAYKGDATYLGADCGAFTTVVMRDSGADPNYNNGLGPTTEQQAYLERNPQKYQKIGVSTGGNFIQQLGLKPGDIAVSPNHTYFFVGGAISNWGGNAASASQASRTAMASTAYSPDFAGVNFTWYRLIE